MIARTAPRARTDTKIKRSDESSVARGTVYRHHGREPRAIARDACGDTARVRVAMSERDSARVWFERYAGALVPAHGDPAELAHTYLRLGDLYEERRDVGAAVKWYDQFTNLWATTDAPVLQARVREVRGRVDRLRKQVTLK